MAFGGQRFKAQVNPTMNKAGNKNNNNSSDFTAVRCKRWRYLPAMKRISLVWVLLVLLVSGCTTSTVRSTQLAQGAALLAIEPVKAHVVVDTTQTLQAVSQTKVILGIFRFGDREFAEYPGMIFQRGPGAKERKAAIHKALKGTDFDVMVNPKYIVQEKHRPFVRKVTVQVAGFGGHLVFENPSE
ncbi:MAG: hypothetical protein RLZZ314_1899 [Bacteroidota bacterium]|jgi:hypothetical protein